MKGIELPVNAIIIIALAIIVLIAIIAFFYPGFFTSEETASKRTALNRACMRLMDYNCEEITSNIQTVDFDADMDGIVGELARNGDNLAMLCIYHYHIDCTNPTGGDVNENCILDVDDWNTCLAVSDATPADPSWIPECDIRGPVPPYHPPDDIIDEWDIGFIGVNIGKPDPSADKICKKLCGCL